MVSNQMQKTFKIRSPCSLANDNNIFVSIISIHKLIYEQLCIQGSTQLGVLYDCTTAVEFLIIYIISIINQYIYFSI